MRLRERLVRAERAEEDAKRARAPCNCGMEKILPAIGRKDIPFKGVQSLLINAHNEGADLVNTVKSFRARCLSPLEILILADMTTDDSLEHLRGWAFTQEHKKLEPVTDVTTLQAEAWAFPNGRLAIVRNTGEQPIGCGKAKQYLSRVATGDFLWHSDGHNRVVHGMLDQGARFGAWAQCVVQPALGPIRQKPHECVIEPVPGNCYYGGRLILKRGIPDIDQQTKYPSRIVARTECVNNSCFGYPRSLLKRFGGWHEYEGRWGFQEAGFSWRCWWTKTAIYVLRDLAVVHRYQDWWTGEHAGEYRGKREEGPAFNKTNWGGAANKRHATMVCFDGATWDGYWARHFSAVEPNPTAEDALKRSSAERQREEFKPLKRRTDIEFFREFAGMNYNPAEATVREGAADALYLTTGGLGNALLCVPAMKALAKLAGRPIDVWDRGLHVKGLRDWLALQTWVRKILTAKPDYRDYRYIVGSYWTAPDIAHLEGCTISPAHRQHRTKHEALSNMEAVRAAGYDGPSPSPCLTVPPGSEPIKDDAVVICTEAAGRRDDVNKCWPHWEECCRQLKAAGVPLVFLGNNDESPAWMDELGIDLIGKTDFMTAVRIVAGARLYVGIDNGLAHVATAVRTPQVLLYGPTSPRKNLQLTQAVHVIASDWQCAPCFDTHRKNRCKNEPKGAMPCMRAIDPERVARKVLHLLDTPHADALPCGQTFLSRKQMVENMRLEMFQQWDELTRLLDLIRDVDPRRVLVIGTHHGAWELVVSGVCSPGTEFVMVDLEDFPQRQETERLLNALGFPTLFIKGDSTAKETVDAVGVALAGQKADVVYIDGYHGYETVDADWKNYGRLAAADGLVVFHDVANFVNDDAPGSRKHWAELKYLPSTWGTMEIRHGRNNGYGVVFVPPAEQPAH